MLCQYNEIRDHNGRPVIYTLFIVMATVIKTKQNWTVLLEH